MGKLTRVASGVGNNGAGATTVSASAGSFARQINDLAIVVVAINLTTAAEDAYTSTATPTGWTFVSGTTVIIETSVSDVQLVGRWFRATSAGTATLAFTSTILSRKAASSITVFRGADTTDNAVVAGSPKSANSTLLDPTGPSGINDDDALMLIAAVEGVRTRSSESTGFTAGNIVSSSGGGGDSTKITVYDDYNVGTVQSGYVADAQLSASSPTLSAVIQIKTATPVSSIIQRTASDTITSISDAISRINNQIRTTSDNITSVSDAVVAAKSVIRAAVDTVATVTDDVARAAISFLRTTTDSVATSDAVMRVSDKIRTVADSMTTSDAVERIMTFGRTVVDTVTTVTDSVVRVSDKIRTSVDTTSITDSVMRTANKIRSVADAITTVTDSLVRSAVSFVRSTTDMTSISDSVTRLADKIRTSVDSTIVSDSVSRSIISIRTAVENIAIGADEVVSQVLTILFRTASDTVTIGADTVGRAVSFVRTLADTTTVSDVVNGARFFARSVVDSITTSDVVVRIATFIKSATDTTTVSDIVVRAGLSLTRTVSDATTSVSDVVIRVSNKTRNAMDTLSVSDAVQRSWIGARQAIDTLPSISDSVIGSTALLIIRGAVDTVSGITDSVSRTANMARGLVDSVITSDSVGRVLGFARIASDTLGTVTDSVVRGGILVRRSVEDTLTIVTDIVNALKGIPKYTGEYIRVLAKQIRFRIGVNDTSDNVHSGPNQVRVTGDNNKERVK